MSNATDHTAISISMDGIWAGSGKLRDGQIEDCGAQFCDDNDESLEVYEMIEDAIENGEDEVRVTLDGEDHTITWTIVEPSIVSE
jgi:hypothetical protein